MTLQGERPAAKSPDAPGSPSKPGVAPQPSTWPDQTSQTPLQEPTDAKGEAGTQMGPAGPSTRRGRASGASGGSRPSLRPKLQARKLSGGLPGPADSSQGASSTAAPATEALLPHDAQEDHSSGARGSAAVRPEASSEEPAGRAVRSLAAAAQPPAEAPASSQQAAQAAPRRVEQPAAVQAASEGDMRGQLPEVAQQGPLRQGSLPHEDRQAVAGLVRQALSSALAAAEEAGPQAQQAGALAAHPPAEPKADATVEPSGELGSERAAPVQQQQQTGDTHVGLEMSSCPGAAQAEVPGLAAVQPGHPDDASSQGSSSSPHAGALANGHSSPSKQASTVVAARGATGKASVVVLPKACHPS